MAQMIAYPDRVETRFYTGATDAEVHAKMDLDLAKAASEGGTFVRRAKIGRNTTCPCGSGRKFKKCCIRRMR